MGKAHHLAKGGRWTGTVGSKVAVMARADLLRIRRLESRMRGNLHVRFGGGRTEKELKSHLAGRLPYRGWLRSAHAGFIRGTATYWTSHPASASFGAPGFYQRGPGSFGGRPVGFVRRVAKRFSAEDAEIRTSASERCVDSSDLEA